MTETGNDVPAIFMAVLDAFADFALHAVMDIHFIGVRGIDNSENQSAVLRFSVLLLRFDGYFCGSAGLTGDNLLTVATFLLLDFQFDPYSPPKSICLTIPLSSVASAFL